MDDKIHIYFSRVGVLKWGAAIFVLFGVIALALALVPLIPSSESGERTRENALDDAYRALPKDPGERHEKLREIEKGALELARGTDSIIIKTSALADAGIATLRSYQEDFKAYNIAGSSQPSLARVDRAVEYLREAARICVERGEHTSCAWVKIQRNLDGAYALLGRDAQGAKEAEGEDEGRASADSPGGDTEDQNLSQQAGEGVTQDVTADVSEVDGLGGKIKKELIGSVRGALSAVPQLDTDGNPSEGGGAASRPVLP